MRGHCIALLILLGLGWHGSALAVDCAAGRSPVAELADQITAAEEAFASTDVEGFHTALELAYLILPCVEDGIPPKVAAQYHRLRGLRQFTHSNPDGTSLSFRAARAVEPDFQMPTAWLPEGHDARELYERSSFESDGSTEVPRPATGHLAFDGRPGRERPTTRPTLFQHIDDEGHVLTTALLDPTDPLPSYPERGVWGITPREAPETGQDLVSRDSAARRSLDTGAPPIDNGPDDATTHGKHFALQLIAPIATTTGALTIGVVASIHYGQAHSAYKRHQIEPSDTVAETIWQDEARPKRDLAIAEVIGGVLLAGTSVVLWSRVGKPTVVAGPTNIAVSCAW